MSVVCGRPTLVRVCDLAGRERGVGFLADESGTVVTSHEAVDGLAKVVLHAGTGTCLAADGDIVQLPEWDLALVRTQGLDLAPLVIGRERPHAGGPVGLLTPDGTVSATLGGPAGAVYTSTVRYHRLERLLRLDLPEADRTRLHLSGRATGAPVVDTATSAVLGVLGTALHASPEVPHALAVPLHAAAELTPDGPLGLLLRRNAACAPGFGPDLNLAGVLRLAAASVSRATERCAHAVARPLVAETLDQFTRSSATVVALTGDPGAGRTTELAALAARRARGTVPAPSVWLRGADLRPDDDGLRDAVGRALAAAGRDLAASSPGVRAGAEDGAPVTGDPRDTDPDVAARLARATGRPLLVLLDAPEEMPPALAVRLRQWVLRTAGWLRTAGVRLAVACRPEHWEQTGALFPPDMIFTARGTAGYVRLGALPPRQAARVRAAYGLPDAALAPRDAGHPLAIRMLAQVRAAQGLRGDESAERQGAQEESTPAEGALVPPSAGGACESSAVSAAASLSARGAPRPARPEILSAFFDLLCLRVAHRLAAREGGDGTTADADGTRTAERVPATPRRAAPLTAAPCPSTVRRLAARVSGQLHDAARRCLEDGGGELSRALFDALFPWSGGWASAVLAEGALAPAGDGYRFVDEELADWLQGGHLQLDAALETLVLKRRGAAAAPVPRHRIGPVVQALLLCDRREGPEALGPRLRLLVGALTAGGTDTDAAWWAAHLLGQTLPRVPDAYPYARVLRDLAEYVAEREPDRASDVATEDAFGPGFWRALPLRADHKAELLRPLLPADPPADALGRGQGRRRDRYVDVLGELLAAEPRALQPLLCEWFSDLRPLRRRADMRAEPPPTVAGAAQALLHTHRGRAVDDLCDALAAAAHPRADDLLAELADDEPSALCRAVHRWARDPRGQRAVTSATHALRLARRNGTEGDRESLRRAARALLSRAEVRDSHEIALTVLVRDPHSRPRHLGAALRRFAASGGSELAAALSDACTTHPEQVFAAFHALLTDSASAPARSQAVRSLACLRTPALARRAAMLVRQHAAVSPGLASEDVAAYVAIRLGHGPAARAVLRPLVGELLRDQGPAFRTRLARTLGAARGRLRDELFDLLVTGESETSVLQAALEAVMRDSPVPAPRQGDENPEDQLVRRIGLRMGTTAQGAAAFDRTCARLAPERPE
ncbi:serine protease [Streptomyces tubbatahanensis]|uniref:Serine protease n=1 Tax=Streptomyces tubbatahanensis TaxID=2923272 RepID=A0ABY3XY91_9ACTN|nr:serine protease [Streptomyces tubbatahanensis]UNS99321.1 serine protease [Streptomyces tubbatahanensis]